MAKKLFKVIWKSAISVARIKRYPDDAFEAESTDKEIKKLVEHKYLEAV